MHVSAEVILVPRGGRSLAGGSMQVTADTVDAFRPAEQTKPRVRSILEDRGFTVHDSGVSLTIEGEPETFERALGVRLDVNRKAAPGEAIVTTSGEPRVPDELRDLVETVAFPKRAHMFGQPPHEGRQSHG